MSQPLKVMYPPTWLLLAVLAMLILHHATTQDRVIPVELAPLGLAIIGLGVALGVWAFVHFQRADTPAMPFEPARKLVISGPYNYSRNPMYLGLIIILVGLGVYLGSLTSFAVIPLFVWILWTRFIRPEEVVLSERFGDDYTAYKAGVRRWV